MRVLLAALALCIAAPAVAVPIEHYRLTYEVVDEVGRPDLMPSAFGDLSVGAVFNLDLCWNSDAQPLPDAPTRFPGAVCGYSIQLGEYTVSNSFPDSGQFSIYSAGVGFGLDDEVPHLVGPDASSWFMDEIQFGFGCSALGAALPERLDVCAGASDMVGGLAIGPLSHPNAFPCTTGCGAGGSIFSTVTSIRPLAVPEPSTAMLLILGLLGIRTARERASPRRISNQN